MAAIFKAERSGNSSMAKRPSRMSRYVRGNIDESLALSTLAAKTLVGAAFDESVREQARITSIEAVYGLIDWTAGAGDGPIIVGVAHSDYSDGEIEAVIEATGSWDIGDKVAQEVANRLVRIIGSFRSDTASTFAQFVMNDGRPVKTKLNWKFATGNSLKVFAYNAGTSALATGAVVSLNGHANIFYDG